MDRNVLVQFYGITNGKSWARREGWAESANDLSSWFGVTLNEEGRVGRLELQGDVSRKPSIKIFYTGINVCGESVTPPGKPLHTAVPPINGIVFRMKKYVKHAGDVKWRFSSKMVFEQRVRVTFRSRVLRCVRPHEGYGSVTLLLALVASVVPASTGQFYEDGQS